MKILTPAEMRDLDLSASEKLGIPEGILMENAASASMAVLMKQIQPSGKNGLIICGSGNNGGDGFALARKLFSLKFPFTVILFGDSGKFTPVTLTNYHSLKKIQIPLMENPQIKEFSQILDKADYLVDALLGTGLNRPVSGLYAQIIQLINERSLPVLSLDIPSGINGSTGAIEGKAVRASATVTFGSPKRGNLLYPGYEENGTLFCSRISFPPSLYDSRALTSEVNLPPPLPPRNQEGYKNSFGKILIIGGGKTYFGAPALAAQAVFRSGGGFVTAALPEQLGSSFSRLCPEAVLAPMKSDEHHGFSEANGEELLELSSRHTAVILGPGITRSIQVQNLLEKLIPAIPVPVIIDADALHALAGHPEWTRNRKAATVLTPHAGEQRVLRRDLPSGETIEKAFQAITVYKGPHSAIKTPDGREFLNMTGNSALGTAGSGDVLTGIIAGLTATLGMEDAVKAAVLLHGLTAQLAEEEIPQDSFTASDIIRYLPRALGFYRKNHSSLSESCYNTIYTLP